MRGLVIPRCVMLVGFFLHATACRDKPPTSPEQIKKEPNATEVPDPLKPAPSTKTDADACAKLRELGCVEGAPKRGKCEDTFRDARTNEPPPNKGRTDAVVSCVATAKTVAAVRMCGGPDSITVECPGR